MNLNIQVNKIYNKKEERSVEGKKVSPPIPKPKK